jgi:hypothetical protein
MFAALKVAQPRSVKKSGLQRLIRSVTQTTVNKMSYSEEHIRNKLTKELEASHVVSTPLFYLVVTSSVKNAP